MYTHEFSPFADGNVEVWGLFDFRQDTESHCVAPSPEIELYTEAFPVFMPLKAWGHRCGYKRNPVIYLTWQRQCEDSQIATKLLPKDLCEVAETVVEEMKTDLRDAGDKRVASLDLFDLVPASKEFTDLSRQPEGTFDCALVTYPLAAALLAAAVDTASLSKPKAICFGGWNFYRSKSLLGAPESRRRRRQNPHRVMRNHRALFSAPDRLFDSLKEVGNDVRRLDEEDLLPKRSIRTGKVFQKPDTLPRFRHPLRPCQSRAEPFWNSLPNIPVLMLVMSFSQSSTKEPSVSEREPVRAPNGFLRFRIKWNISTKKRVSNFGSPESELFPLYPPNRHPAAKWKRFTSGPFKRTSLPKTDFRSSWGENIPSPRRSSARRRKNIKISQFFSLTPIPTFATRYRQVDVNHTPP